MYVKLLTLHFLKNCSCKCNPHAMARDCRVGRDGSLGVIPHRLIPQGPSIICIKLFDELLASEYGLAILRVVNHVNLLFSIRHVVIP